MGTATTNPVSVADKRKSWAMKTPSAPISTQIMKLTSKYTNALSSVGQ